jgi:hypothetical protein
MDSLLPLLIVAVVVGCIFAAVHGLNRVASGTNHGQLILAGIGLLIVGALWYFLIYDTAEGKCRRGDLGACVVWQSEQGR